MTRPIPDKAIKYDIAGELDMVRLTADCADTLARHADADNLAERCAYTLVQDIGAQLLEKEYGCRFLGMGDGLFMPEPTAKRLSDMASEWEAENLPASGTLTEGGDVEQAPGDSLGGPTREAGDAHNG